jgi:hypothetical protein
MERWRIHFLTFTHSSSSAPNPSNLTRTSYNNNTEILSNKKCEIELTYATAQIVMKTQILSYNVQRSIHIQ